MYGILIFVGFYGFGKIINVVDIFSKKVGIRVNDKKCVVVVCKFVDEVEGKLDDSNVIYVLFDDGLE